MAKRKRNSMRMPKTLRVKTINISVRASPFRLPSGKLIRPTQGMIINRLARLNALSATRQRIFGKGINIKFGKFSGKMKSKMKGKRRG